MSCACMNVYVYECVRVFVISEAANSVDIIAFLRQLSYTVFFYLFLPQLYLSVKPVGIL